MAHDSLAGAPRSGVGGRAFWWRLADNAFRRLGWFLLPILALGALGTSRALDTPDLYRTSARLSAATNPLLPEQTISGVNPQMWETPAAANARIMSDRLGTNSFAMAVAAGAGLGDDIQNGALDLSVVRESVWASANGDSILSVTAQWADPQTSYQLVVAAITEYRNFITESVASDANEAEAFYSEQLENFEAERNRLDEQLTAFVEELPPLTGADQEYPVDVQLELDRLTAELTSIEAKVDEAQGQIDLAQLARSQQSLQADRNFAVIDEPEQPTAPESTVVKKGMLVISFALMGLVISVAALLVTTALDHSVCSTADLMAIEGVSRVATVPRLRLSAINGVKRSRSRGKVKVKRRTSAPVHQGVA